MPANRDLVRTWEEMSLVNENSRVLDIGCGPSTFTLPLGEVAVEIVALEKTVVITFDDGYASNYEYAYPILKKYHFRAVQFPLTSCIAKTTCWVPRLTWEMMGEASDVFEFHSHSHSLHHYIDGKPAMLAKDPETIIADLRHSRELLDCFAFAYPFGAYSNKTISLLKQTGYSMALTIQPGYVRLGDDPFQLKRLGAYPDTGMNDFAKMSIQISGTTLKNSITGKRIKTTAIAPQMVAIPPKIVQIITWKDIGTFNMAGPAIRKK